MELQKYIDSHSNFISEFRKLSFKVRTFKKLKIVSFPYDLSFENSKPEDIRQKTGFPIKLCEAIQTRSSKI